MDSNISEQYGTTLSRSWFGWFVALICLVCPSNAFAGYSSLYIFGDSPSDSGNNAVVLAPNVTPVPISGNNFIPTYPYASGRYTNGQTWAQTLASALGLNAGPSLLGGTDYAFGGAQTGPATQMHFRMDYSFLFRRASRPKPHSFCPNTVTQRRVTRST